MRWVPVLTCKGAYENLANNFFHMYALHAALQMPHVVRSQCRQLHDARVKAEQHAAHGMEIEPGMASPSESEDDGPPFDMNAFYPTVLPLQHPDTATIDEVDASADTAVELRATTPVCRALFCPVPVPFAQAKFACMP